MRYLLDTNTCIYIIEEKPIEVLDRLRSVSISEVGVSSITASELAYGIEKSTKRESNRLVLRKFLMALGVLPYDHNTAQCYGALRAELERKGRLIGALDMLIAAHALSLGSILVTNNVKEFMRVPRLQVENWAVQDE